MKVEELEKLAGKIGLLIKIQVRETLGLCFFRIVINIESLLVPNIS